LARRDDRQEIIGDRFDQAIAEHADREAQRADRIYTWYMLLDLLIRKRTAGTDRAVV